VTPRTDHRHILVVEDDEDLREALRRILEVSFPVRVEAAADAREALRKLAEGPLPQVVLSDLRMPGMDGLELASEVHRRHPCVAFALMTAFRDADIERRVDGHPEVAAFFEKPHEVAAWQRALGRVIALPSACLA